MNKPTKLHLLTIIIRYVFIEDGKYYPQLFLDDALYDVQKCNMISFWFFVNENFNYKGYACNGCHNLLMMAFSLDNIAVLNVGNVFYRCIFMGISKNEGLKRLNNASNLGKRDIV